MASTGRSSRPAASSPSCRSCRSSRSCNAASSASAGSAAQFEVEPMGRRRERESTVKLDIESLTVEYGQVAAPCTGST